MDENTLYHDNVLSIEILPVFIPPEEGKSPWANVDITDYSFAKKCYGNAGTYEDYCLWAYWELHDFLMSAPGLTKHDCDLINTVLDISNIWMADKFLGHINIDCKIDVKIHNNSGSMDFTVTYPDERTDSVFILASNIATAMVGSLFIILSTDISKLQDMMVSRFNIIRETCMQCTPLELSDYYTDREYANKTYIDALNWIIVVKQKYGDDVVTKDVEAVIHSAFSMIYQNHLKIEGETDRPHPFAKVSAIDALCNIMDAETDETDSLEQAYFIARDYILPSPKTGRQLSPVYALMALFNLEHVANAYIERDHMNINKVETFTIE